jgi:CBS domain-containing protein
MQVKEVMTTGVAFCDPVTNIATAAERMWTHDCGVLPVLEDGNQLVGIVTDRDLFIALGTQDRRPSEVRVDEVMHRKPAICTPNDEVRNALKTMAAEHIHRLPVVDNSGALKGMLSIDDVITRATPSRNGVFADEIVGALTAICERAEKSHA